MADETLNPGLRQIAEQYLNRPLQPDEEAQLVKFQQGFQRQPGPASGAPQQAQQQAQQAVAQARTRAGTGMRGILESIQASSAKALQVQEKEEQAILKLLESCSSLAELRPSSLQPGMSALQPGTRLALTQIAEHLSNLARQEVENCFNQTIAPLVSQLQTLIQRLAEEDAQRASANGQAAGEAAASNAPAQPAAGVHAASGQAS